MAESQYLALLRGINVGGNNIIRMADLKECFETAEAAMKSIRVKEGVDAAAAGKRALYFSRLKSRASSSHLTRIISLPIYQDMTIRNWTTTTGCWP